MLTTTTTALAILKQFVKENPNVLSKKSPFCDYCDDKRTFNEKEEYVHSDDCVYGKAVELLKSQTVPA